MQLNLTTGLSFILAFIVAFVLAACSSSSPSSERSKNAEPIKKVELGTMKNLQAQGEFYLGSQPSDDDIKLLRDNHGIKTVVNIRSAPEMSELTEKEAVQSAGMKYVHLGFRGPDTMTDNLLTELREVLGDPKNRPLILHCKSGNRVGAVWYAFRVLDEGIPEAQALAEAKQVGLRSEGHLRRSQEYVQNQRK